MDDTDNSTNNVKVSSVDGSIGSGSTGAFDCIRPHLKDIMDFLADVHTLSKLKSNSRAMSPGPGLPSFTCRRFIMHSFYVNFGRFTWSLWQVNSATTRMLISKLPFSMS
ncbi:hypothetical protein GHT06_021749 [Daphnia sinensis]|uniref:Uncharacterized protein n=1 Tax=Daphnia sinensis TaxID=1820382 RepID=A0AAD5PL08_9CRUS|nr:hypothetical protein GHT06_021749 [Daphnia sinensis]